MAHRSALNRLAPLLDSPTAEGRLALLENIDSIAERAMSHEAISMSGGQEVSLPRPDFATAVRCQEYGAKLLGVGPRQIKPDHRLSSSELVAFVEANLVALIEAGGRDALAAARLVLEQRGLLVKTQVTASADLSEADKDELARRLEKAAALGVLDD